MLAVAALLETQLSKNVLGVTATKTAMKRRFPVAVKAVLPLFSRTQNTFPGLRVATDIFYSQLRTLPTSPN